MNFRIKLKVLGGQNLDIDFSFPLDCASCVGSNLIVCESTGVLWTYGDFCPLQLSVCSVTEVKCIKKTLHFTLSEV